MQLDDACQRPVAIGGRLLALILFLAVLPAAQALNPDRNLDQYTRQVWSLDNGLPQATITAIVQGQDRYLYIATFGGVLRFDGIRFEAIDDAGGCGNRFGSLTVGAAGGLWAGISRGGLCRVQMIEGRQSLVPFRPANDVEIRGVRDLLPRAGGGIWAATTQGLIEITGQQARRYDESDGLPDRQLTRIFPGESGAVWVLTDRGLCRFAGGRCSVPAWAEANNDRRFEVGIVRGNGEILISSVDELFRIDEGRVKSIPLPDHLGGIRDLLEDSRGNLWLGTSRAGLKRLAPRPALELAVGETVRYARVLFEDDENNLWVGYSGDGLARLSDGKAHAVHVPDLARSLDVLAIEERPDGGVWVAAPCAGVASVDGSRIEVVETQQAIGTGCVWALLNGQDGRLWIGTYGEGLALREPDGTLRSIGGPSTHEQIVRALTWDRASGELLVGSDQGVWRYAEASGGFRLIGGTGDLDVHYLATADDGTIWVGSRSGATRIGEDVEHFDIRRGLAENYVRAIKIDGDGIVWLGTYGGGLHRLEGDRIVHYGPEQGLPDAIVSRIIEDEAERFWMSGNLGVTRVAREQLEAFARGEIERIEARLYNARDGMPISETNGGGQSAGLLRDNGELWIPTIHGLAVFDTRSPDRLLLPPPVRIERVLVDGQARNPELPIDLPPTARNLEIQYTAPAFSAPERVRFRYRLDGYDTQWTEAGGRRAAYFPIIPPGEFRFRVSAAHGSNDWSDGEGGLLIRMQPTFTQSVWFLPTLVVAVAALVGLMFWVRVRGLRRREEELKFEVRKRTAELERLAALDGLTGVPNRRAFDQRLDQEWSRLGRSRQPLSVLLIDVDHFKPFNDRYGHQAGDECLKTIASALSETLRREIELLARIGGEEFGVILPETTAEAAAQTAERLRRIVAELAIAHEDAETATIVTVSIGGATVIPGPDSATGSLFESADQALYDAKSRGRNQITLHGSSPGGPSMPRIPEPEL
jgi:diguanylate cyclase (GGDEF)-like protein